MEIDPGTIRRLGLALPAAVIQDAGGAHDGAASRAAVLLGRSPRLRSASSAFEVRVQPAGAGLRVCLFAPLGASLGCGEAQPEHNGQPNITFTDTYTLEGTDGRRIELAR